MVEQAIVFTLSAAVSSLATARAESPLSARNMQIDLWSILSNVKA
jgi:hypothetical protein